MTRPTLCLLDQMIQQGLVIVVLRCLLRLIDDGLVLLHRFLQYGLQIRVNNLHVVVRLALPDLLERPSPSGAQAERKSQLHIAEGRREPGRHTFIRCDDCRRRAIVVRVWEVVLEAVDAVAEEELGGAVEGKAGDEVLEIEGVTVPEVRLHLLDGEVYRKQH